MGFKKIKYGEEPVLELELKDEIGKRVGKWKISISDIWKFANIIAQKYGIKKNQDNDLDWLQ